MLLLVGRSVVGDDLGVAGVGRLAAEHDGRPLRAAEDLVEQREVELAVSLAAELGTEMCGPQPLAPHLFLQRVDHPAPRAVERNELVVREEVVERLDLFADEVLRPVELLLVLGVGLEIPGHGCSCPTAAAAFDAEPGDVVTMVAV